MGGVADGSRSSPPKVKYLPVTENEDGSMGVDISILPSSENPETVSASVDCVAEHCRSQNKELRVKVQWAYFSFIRLLFQMGFDKIAYSESTYIVLREDKSSSSILCANDIIEKIASGVTPMQSGAIARSSDPCNLICSQTPDKTLAIQIPSEIAYASDWKVVAGSGDTRVEQGAESQRSSRASPSGPAGMGNDIEAAGLQRFSTGFEIPEFGVRTQKRSHPADESELPSTRSRGPDFEDEAKGLLLWFKLEYHQDPASKGKSHKWLMPVTAKMKENGYERDPAAWRGLWDTLKKSRDAMRRRFPQGSGYWDLAMVEKKAYKKTDRHFPLIFKPEWYDAIESIEKIEPRSAAKKETRRDGQEGVFSQPLASTITGSANFAGAGSSNANIQASVQHPRQASAQGSDEHLLVNRQRSGAPPSGIHDYLPFLHSQREKDYQEISVTIQEQLAVEREDVQLTVSASKKLMSASKKMMESSRSESLGAWADALLQNPPL